MDTTRQIEEILTKAGNAINGYDSDNHDITYDSIAEWKSTILINDAECESSKHIVANGLLSETSEELRSQWYQTGHDYYEDESNCPPTVDGVLGGFAHLSSRDLKASKQFVERLKADRADFTICKSENDEVDTYALECGAGIGRVSKGLLFPLGFTKCDLVEPSRRLLSHAPEYIGHNASHCRYFCIGLQDFTPQPDKYNLIFIQWVIGYLTDDDLLSFLKRCAVGLRKGGVIIIKDNTCVDVAFVADREDASVTRSLPYILAIVKLAGLKVVMEEYQDDFPKDIFPVPMLALGRCDD